MSLKITPKIRRKMKKSLVMHTDKGKSANHPIQTIRKVRFGNFLLIARHRKPVKWTNNFREYFEVELLDENYHGPRFESYKRCEIENKFKEFFKVAIKNIGTDLYSNHLGL